MPAHTMAARAPPWSMGTPSSKSAPITAPAALAPNSTLYQTSASSEPCWWANSGICAWNAVPTKSDVAPASTIIRMIRGSERISETTRKVSAKLKRGIGRVSPRSLAWPVYGMRKR